MVSAVTFCCRLSIPSTWLKNFKLSLSVRQIRKITSSRRLTASDCLATSYARKRADQGARNWTVKNGPIRWRRMQTLKLTGQIAGWKLKDPAISYRRTNTIHSSTIAYAVAAGREAWEGGYPGRHFAGGGIWAAKIQNFVVYKLADPELQFRGPHGERGARVGVWGGAPNGVQGQSPWSGGHGAKPPWLKAFYPSDVQRTQQICNLDPLQYFQFKASYSNQGGICRKSQWGGRDRVAVAHQHKIGHLVSYLEIQWPGYVPRSPANTTLIAT